MDDCHNGIRDSESIATVANVRRVVESGREDTRPFSGAMEGCGGVHGPGRGQDVRRRKLIACGNAGGIAALRLVEPRSPALTAAAL